MGGWVFSPSTLMLGSLAAALLTAAFTEGLVKVFRLQEDASVGLVFSALFALGILLVTLYTRDVHLSVEAIMGNADALQIGDFNFASLLAALNLSVLIIFYRQLKISAFDRQYASALGVPASFSTFCFFSYLLQFLWEFSGGWRVARLGFSDRSLSDCSAILQPLSGTSGSAPL